MSDGADEMPNSNKESESHQFSFNTRAEVERFEEMLQEHIRLRVSGLVMGRLPLTKLYDLHGRRKDDGKKIFWAAVDIQINLVMLTCDHSAANGLINTPLMQDKAPVCSILDSQLIFDAKMEIHRHTTNFILRCRALWEKVIGIFVLIIAPNEYEKFVKNRSQKKDFKKIMDTSKEVGDFADAVLAILAAFDKFRTPEAHGQGRLRKSTLSMQSYAATPLIEMPLYWGGINGVIATLGESLSQVE